MKFDTQYISTSETARLLNLTTQVILKRIHNGEIIAKMGTKCWYIPIDQFRRLKLTSTLKPRPLRERMREVERRLFS